MKKWTLMVATGLLLGATPVFTGCVDNDEPAGISDLRGAKAELIRAKIAVEEANALLIKAQAEYALQQAAVEKANAAYRNAEAAKQQALADREAALTEAEKARYDLLIQQYQQQMEESALEHERYMYQLQANVAEAKAEYEVVLAEIKIAEATLSGTDRVSIAQLRAEVERTYAIVYGGDYYDADGKLIDTIAEGESKYDILFNKEKDLYDAQHKKLSGQGDDGSYDKDSWIPALQVDSARYEAQIEAQTKAIELLQSYIDEDVESNDWLAELDALIETLDDLNAQISQKEVELKQAESTDAYLSAQQALEGVKDESGNLIKDGATQVLTAKETALNKELDKTKVKIAAYKSEEFSDIVLGYLNEAKKNMELDDDLVLTSPLKYEEVETVWGSQNYADEKQPQDIADIVETVDAWVKIANNAVTDANDIASAQAKIEALKKAEAEAKTDYENAKKAWSEVLDIVKNQKDYDVPTTEFVKVTSAYNTAYDKLVSAAGAYNSAMQSAYDEAYAEEEASQKLSVKVSSLNNANVQNVAGFSAIAALNQWNALQTSQQTDSEFTNIINKNCSEVKNGQQVTATVAQVQAAVWAQINNYVSVTCDINWSGWNAIKAAAETAAQPGNFDKDGKLQKAITDAASEVATAFGKLNAAISDFKDLAETYAQVLTDDAAKKLTTASLVGDKTSWYEVKDGKYTVLNTKIEDTEIAAATDTKYSESLKTTAVDAKSMDAFGMVDRWVEPTEKEIRDAYAVSQTDSKAMDWYTACDNVQAQQDKIDSADDLKALQEALAKQQTALNDEIEKAFNESYGDEVAAVEKAQEDYDAKKAAFDAEKAKNKDIEIELAKLQAKENATNEVYAELKTAIETYLNIELPNQYNAGKFVERLQKKLFDAKEKLADAQQDLAAVKADLEKARTEDNFDFVAVAQRAFENAQREFDKAYDAYTEAMANLEKGLDILAGESSAE